MVSSFGLKPNSLWSSEMHPDEEYDRANVEEKAALLLTDFETLWSVVREHGVVPDEHRSLLSKLLLRVERSRSFLPADLVDRLYEFASGLKYADGESAVEGV